MVDREILTRKLLVLREALSDLESAAVTSASQLAENRMLRAAVERWIQVAVEACIDIAFHVVADAGWTPVDTGRSAFLSLASHGILELELAQRLGKAASMRNLLVHEYAAIELDQLARVAGKDVADLAQFGQIASGWLPSDL